MAGIEFLRPRLRGARFDDGAIPLEIFTDLLALREMVIEVAGWRFIQEHPERQWLPRGFANSVDLKLAGIADGNAIAVIHLTVDAMELAGSQLPYQPFFEMAREDIVNAIGAVEQDDRADLDQLLPKRYLAYFNRIGRSLQNDECMELSSPERVGPVRLTQETRDRLLQRSSVTEVARVVTARGVVSEADQARMTFELQQIHGHKVTGAMSEQHLAIILDAFHGYKNNTRILVRGIGIYDRSRRLSRLETTEHIALLDPLDVPARLDEFRIIQHGWLDGDGLAPSHRGLDWLAAAFERHFPNDIPLPYTYPTPAGGVQMEWSLGSQEISLEIDLDNRRALWHRLDMTNNADDEKELDLVSPAGWEWLGAEVSRWEGIHND